MKCNNCDKEITQGSKFCSHCGSKIELQIKICPNKACRKTGLPQDALFCPDCGTKITDHFYNKNEICEKCGCSKIAIDSFGWKCKK